MIPPQRRQRTAFRRKPRASGDDPATDGRPHWSRVVNPARAGMILIKFDTSYGNISKPRASGDDPYSKLLYVSSGT